MAPTTNPLKLELSDVLGDAGFKRKKDSWYRRSLEVVEVVNLQKSQYGDQYYLNYGIWLLDVGEADAPKDWLCHIHLRIEGKIPSGKRLRVLLDLEVEMADEARRGELRGLFTDEFLPWAASCRTKEGLRRLLAAGDFSGAGLRWGATEVLGPKPEG